MAYNNLFVDSDIILDVMLQREPHYQLGQLLFIEGKSNVTLSTSTLIIANVAYVLGSQLGKAGAKKAVGILMEELNVLSFEPEDITEALKTSFSDFEDSIQHGIALKHKCEAIITRNTKDYKHSAIPVLTAEQFLRTI